MIFYSELVNQWHIFMAWWLPIDKTIEEFVYYYPLFMAYVWMFGAIIFCLRYEWHKPKLPFEKCDNCPAVSILIPCYNEGENVRETIGILQKQQYSNFEIIKQY